MTPIAVLPLNGAVTPAYWVLLNLYGDDQDELRRLFRDFRDCFVFASNDFIEKRRHRHFIP